MAIDVENKVEVPSNRSLLSGLMKFDDSRILFDRFCPKTAIDNKILIRKPLILDPSNPFNNFAHIDIDQMNLFRKFARVVWGRLSCVSNMKIIFRPQPKAFATKSMIKFLPPLTDWKLEIRKNESINNTR